MKHYIAYGSNLNVIQMKYRCPDATIVGTAELSGYRLLYKGSQSGSYLTIEEAEGKSVPVAIWRISALDERSLDIYEGFPHFYTKRKFKLDVATLDGVLRNLPCFAYVMKANRKPGIPTPRYIQTCKDGYEDFGFDVAVLDKALDDTKAEICNSQSFLSGLDF